MTNDPEKATLGRAGNALVENAWPRSAGFLVCA